jgi:hypothetical protein
MGARNQVGIGLSYWPASQCNLATQFQTRFLELVPRPIAGLKFSTLISMFECFSSFPPFQYTFLALLTYFLPPFNLSSGPFQPFFHSPFIHSFARFQPSLIFTTVRHVTGNDQDYLRKIPRVIVQKSALL